MIFVKILLQLTHILNLGNENCHEKTVILFAFAYLGIFDVMQAQNIQSDGSKAYVVSDVHLDTQWNWDIQTTIKEYVWNTLNQNLFSYSYVS